MINQTELSSNFAVDCLTFQGALGDKNSNLLTSVGMCVAGFSITFARGWLLTLVVSSIIPVILLTGLAYVWAIR